MNQNYIVNIRDCLYDIQPSVWYPTTTTGLEGKLSACVNRTPSTKIWIISTVHTCTSQAAQHCVNSDISSQRSKFDPIQNRKQWSDYQNIWHRWLGPRSTLYMQNLVTIHSMTSSGQIGETKRFMSFISAFLRQHRGQTLDRCWRLMAQRMRNHARMCCWPQNVKMWSQ